MRYRMTPWAAFALLAMATVVPAIAAPNIELDVATEREVVDAETGNTQRVAVQQASPGTELLFTVRYRNSGDEDATDVVIENAIPAGVVFLRDMRAEAAGALFSIDDGASFARAEELKFEVTLEDGSRVQRTAQPEQYTHVRWVVDRVAKGSSGDREFRVRVK